MEKIIDDINDGANWMVDQGYANPNRMCIIGQGYGGYAALQTTLVEPSLYKCSVALAPFTNLERIERDYFGYFIDNFRSDDFDTGDVSPSRNAEKFTVPVLLAHGAYDRNVFVEQSQYLARNMRNAGKDVKYIEWEDGDHFLSKQKHRVEFLEEMGRFLKKHL